MAYGVKLKVWGDYASFNRPEMKVERVSYDVMTPSAARGILEAIYWKPQMRWVVDKIHILNPIRFTYVRRNEIKCKAGAGVSSAMKSGTGSLGIAVDDQDIRQQRAAMVLRDVCYGIEAHVEILDATEKSGVRLDKPEAKHLEAFKRRASRGQYFHHPYLGCREFPASFELANAFPSCPEPFRLERDLGFMLHDIAFVPNPRGTVIESNKGQKLEAQPRFFRAVMRNGIIDVPALEEAKA